MNSIEIKVTPETLVSISADVTQKISSVQSAFTELEGIIQNTASYWEGDGHDAFVEAYQLRKDNYMSILQSFQDHIANLQQIAGGYQQADTFAEELSLELEGDVII